MRRGIFFLIGVVIGFDNACYSQNISRSDSLEYQAQLVLFDDAIGIEKTEIINGPKHTVPPQVSGTHPFYNSSVGAKGNLTFIGQSYFNLTLLYDTYSDELVVQQLRDVGINLIVLNKTDVESFRIHDHNFKHYQNAQARNMGIAGGFYDVLYENADFKIIARRKKDTQVEMGNSLYKSEDKYLFVAQGRKATPFRGMSNFYQVLGNKALRSELKSFVKENNLSIKRNDGDLIVTARYCDTILRKQK